METLLNVVWLLVACGTFAAYAASGRRVRGGALALVCVVALLFPIISATDDMATDATIIEEWSALRRPTLILATLLLAPVAVFVVPIFSVVEPYRVCAAVIDIPALTLRSSCFATVWSFRPPPFALA